MLEQSVHRALVQCCAAPLVTTECFLDNVNLTMRNVQIAAAEGVAASTPEQAAQSLRAYECHMQGHAIECRLCAEDPCHSLTPSTCVLW